MCVCVGGRPLQPRLRLVCLLPSLRLTSLLSACHTVWISVPHPLYIGFSLSPSGSLPFPPPLPRSLSLSLDLHTLHQVSVPNFSRSPAPGGGSKTHTHLCQTLSLSSGILSLSLPGLSIPLSEVSVPLISLLDQHYLWVSRVLLWVFVL